MTETTETGQTPGDAMRALLTAGARYTGRLNVQAAVYLLTFTDLPDWRGFRDLVHTERVDDQARDETYDAAFVPDWSALLDAKAAQIRGSGRRLLELAVSMAVGVPVNLREALAGFGHVGKRRVVEAVAIATGVEEFYALTFTPTPALGSLLDFHRQMQGGGR
ncbi:hypothetical protein ACIBTV_27720 [Micromonospora sp. NPDC049366]|uniref:hypothetical protein n=1 Tax=Micromonospora sp. NPDC049366 TaxID=3364271 RepID=UPI003787B4A8